MIRLYLLSIWRNFLKNKFLTYINIFGLTFGIAIFIIINLYVKYEKSYDSYHEKMNRIYRLEYAGGGNYLSPGIGSAIYKHIPEIQKCARYKNFDKFLLSYPTDTDLKNSRKVQIDYLAMMDSLVFDIFSFKFLEGTPDNALVRPFNIVLTRSVARKLFGSNPALNEKIRLGNNQIFTVTGVVDDLPQNTHLNFQAMASFVTFAIWRQGWDNPLETMQRSEFFTYVLLPEKHNIKYVENKINTFLKDEYPQYFSTTKFNLRPVNDVYLNGYPNFGSPNNSGDLVSALFIISILIVIIACINYINLSTAKSTDNFVSVGIRKVVGARSMNISNQLFIESLAICIICSLFAILLAFLLLPYFNNIMQSGTKLTDLFKPAYFIQFIITIIIIGILSGSYSSLYFNKSNTIEILKGKRSKDNRSFPVRKLLIIFQFFISIALISTTLFIIKQINYVRNTELGFNKEQILTIEIDDFGNDKLLFEEELLQNPNILGVTFSDGVPGYSDDGESFEYDGNGIGMPLISVEPDYFDFYGLEIIHGRNFDEAVESDHRTKIILNEEAVKRMGVDNAIGEILNKSGSMGGSAFITRNIEIIGVVKDFHFFSLHSSNYPLGFAWHRGRADQVSVRLLPQNMKETIKYIEKCWNKYSNFHFNYDFVDQIFERAYQHDIRFGKLLSAAAFMAIIISIIGILGLSVYSVQKKTKEIGIRKVNGAKVSEILMLLNGEYVKWLLVSFIIAIPVSWSIVTNWLDNFAYRTTLSWWIFTLSGIGVILIASLLVSIQSWRTAERNPVEALRYE